MIAKPPTLADAFHLILGDSAGGSIKVAGVKRCLTLIDPLCPGPCDQNPVRHLRKRREYFVADWGAYDGPNIRLVRQSLREWKKKIIGAKSFARLVARQSKDRSVLFWTTPTFIDRVAFWWMLDALQYANVEHRRCWVVDVNIPDLGPTPLGTISPSQLLDFFNNHVKPLSRVDRESMLWQKFASPSPLDFDRARQAIPGLEQTCEPWGVFFPQAGPRSSLRLSQFDQELFESLARRRWLRPIELLKRNERLINDFFIFGDRLILQRLRAWAQLDGQDPILEKRREERTTSEWNAVSFRLTRAGEQIRDEGLHVLSEAPPIFVGGCKLYIDQEPWVRHNRGRRWWIERSQ